MKNRYILIGLAYIVIGLFDNFKIRVVLAIGIAMLFRYLFNEKKSIIVELFLLVLIICSIPLNVNYFGKGHVCQIRENYCIVNNHFYSTIVYGLENVKLDDEIIIDGPINKISSYSNFEPSSFESYCKGNNIVGQINYDGQKIIEPSFSLRQYFYEQNQRLNKWANYLLFSKGLSIESENSYLIMASGMQISFFIYFLRNLLKKVFYPKRTLQLMIIISFLLNLFFHFPYGYVRVLLVLLLEYLVKDKKDRLGFYIIFLVLLKPYYVKSVSFLIPVGIRLLNMFKNKESSPCITLYITMIQLHFNGCCSLLQVIYFNFYRYISGFFYLLAVFVSLFKIKLPLEDCLSLYLNSIDKLPILKLNGGLNIITCLLIVSLLIKNNHTIKQRYKIYIVVVFVLNSLSSCLNPFYTVTFLDVGQGDCAVIKTPFSSEALLIDVCGNVYKDISKDIIIKYLDRNSLKSCSVIISHDDYDHMGGLQSLVDNFKVNKVYAEKIEQFEFHNLSILNPLAFKEYDNENDNSIISYMLINGTKFLFTGDISSLVESDLINNYPNFEADILKLSHHGSKTATSDKLLRNTNILLGVISVGKNNRYGHPSSEVLERLEKYDIDYLSTATNGAIRLYCFRGFIFYVTSRNGFGLIIK